MLAIYRISLIVTLYTIFFILAWTCLLKTPWLALKLSTLFDLKWYSPRETDLFSFSKKESREAIVTAPPSCFTSVCLELKIWLPWKRDVTALVLYWSIHVEGLNLPQLKLGKIQVKYHCQFSKLWVMWKYRRNLAAIWHQKNMLSKNLFALQNR